VPYRLPALVARCLDIDQGFARSLTKAVRRPSRNLLVNQGHRPGHAQPSGGLGPTRNKVVFAREPISCRYAPLLTPDLTANIPIRRFRVNNSPDSAETGLPKCPGEQTFAVLVGMSQTCRQRKSVLHAFTRPSVACRQAFQAQRWSPPRPT
jgi:hypothetical protein